MDKIRFVAGAPMPFTNHVVIERSAGATFRFEGVSNARSREPERFLSKHFGRLQDAKVAAQDWAAKHGIDVVYLPWSCA